MKVYLDNAATTPLDPEVLKTMLPFLENEFGNPSSSHQFGRRARAGIETVRRRIAASLNCTPAEIIFTSGGTEADNMAIHCGIFDAGIKHFISARIEHKAVLSTLERYADRGLIKLSFVNLTEVGHVDLNHLEELLREAGERSFVSLMHANNEIGNLTDIHAVGTLCRKYDALFHSDTVQTMAHYRFDLKELPVDFVTASAHKFHGPKGVGFLYARNPSQLQPLIVGGSQERNHRGGTENLYGIVGLGAAFERAWAHMDEHQRHITALKNKMRKLLEEQVPGIDFNGCANQSLYTVLNARFADCSNAEMFLFMLDIEGVAVYGGSACNSGATTGSHVLQGVYGMMKNTSVRFSFSRFNTEEEIEYAADKVRQLCPVPA